MKITFDKGSKCEEDIIMKIETNGVETFSMLDFAYCLNFIACNEIVIIDSKPNLSVERHFWLKNVIDRSIEDAKKHINWMKQPKEYFNEFTTYPYFISRRTIDKFLRDRDRENGKKEEIEFSYLAKKSDMREVI